MAEHVNDFVRELAPIATRIGAEYGINPALIVTQAAIESGWGKEVAGNNYFGVKSHGQPGGQTILTHEEVNGQLVPVYDSFRQYDTLEGSMRDYAKFLKDNPRYSGVFSAPDLQGQIDAIASSGYATSSKYPGLLNDVSRMVTRAWPQGGNTPSPQATAYAPTPAPRSQNPALKGIVQATLPNIGPPGSGAQPAVMRSGWQQAWANPGMLFSNPGALFGGQPPAGAAPIMRATANIGGIPQAIMRGNPAMTVAGRTAAIEPTLKRIMTGSAGGTPLTSAVAAQRQPGESAQQAYDQANRASVEQAIMKSTNPDTARRLNERLGNL